MNEWVCVCVWESVSLCGSRWACGSTVFIFVHTNMLLTSSRRAQLHSSTTQKFQYGEENVQRCISARRNFFCWFFVRVHFFFAVSIRLLYLHLFRPLPLSLCLFLSLPIIWLTLELAFTSVVVIFSGECETTVYWVRDSRIKCLIIKKSEVQPSIKTVFDVIIDAKLENFISVCLVWRVMENSNDKQKDRKVAKNIKTKKYL